MAKRLPQMTSSDASSVFKSKISESLPFLGFLDNEDKADVWRFWKTVSSAVKIAVNGKGDIIETPRRNSKSAKYARDKEIEDIRLQQLDRHAISIYVPIKCTSKGFQKFRILKLANQKKIADYFETVAVEDEDYNSDANFGVNDLENIDFTKLTSGDIENLSSKELVAKELNNSDLSRVDGDLQTDVKKETTQTSATLTDTPSGSGMLNTIMPKQAKKIWPVGRPTTRSSSGARVIKDKTSYDIKKQVLTRNSNISLDKDILSKVTITDSSTVETNTITFFPHVKEETAEAVEEDFNITIVPVGDSVMQMQITQSGKSISSEEEHLDSGQTSEGQTEPSENYSIVLTQGSSESSEVHIPTETIISNTVSPYQLCVSLPDKGQNHLESLEGIRDQGSEVHETSEMVNLQDNQEFTNVEETSSQSEGGDQQPKQLQAPVQGHLVSRNASDIETIITALEEELKKTGSNIATIAVSSASSQNIVEDVPSSAVDEINVREAFVDHHGQTVQIFDGQEIVEVQQVDNVIWTSGGEVRIVEPDQVFNGSNVAEGVVYDSQPVEAQYDVVEYEVLADRRQKRGRKRKPRDENGDGKSDLVDRTCPMCHRVLNYASSMTAHMRIHTGARPYSCGQCDRKFTTKANRDRHEATHVGLKPFQCTQCSKSFTEKRSLKIHMRTHTGERPFVCDICGQRFTQKCTLIVHMDRHTNKKGHLCDLCGKAFRQKCQLDVHVKRHNRQAMFPCNECSTKCYTKGDLVRHMIKHTGERPFQCKLCPRAFTRKQYLVDHENQHYGRKPYKCSECSASFHDMGACHRHLKKHKIEEDEENTKTSSQAAVLSSSDFHRILEGTQIGQILKLDDGTDALVKAVVSEADGSTVYHITCLGTSGGMAKSTTTTITETQVPAALYAGNTAENSKGDPEGTDK